MKQVKKGLHPIIGNKKVTTLVAQPIDSEDQGMGIQIQKTVKIKSPLSIDDRKWLKYNGSKAQNESALKCHIPDVGGSGVQLSDKHNAFRKRNLVFDTLTDGILFITVDIRTEFPELYNVLTETPVRYNGKKAEISTGELLDYLEVITCQLESFRKSKIIHNV